jgi:hypothetical protein
VTVEILHIPVALLKVSHTLSSSTRPCDARNRRVCDGVEGVMEGRETIKLKHDKSGMFLSVLCVLEHCSVYLMVSERAQNSLQD